MKMFNPNTDANKYVQKQIPVNLFNPNTNPNEDVYYKY